MYPISGPAFLKALPGLSPAVLQARRSKRGGKAEASNGRLGVGRGRGQAFASPAQGLLLA
jgi:hypothetical protein